MQTDKILIEALGGPAAVAKLLGYAPHGGVQRVHNWMKRGIPAKVKLDYPSFFQPSSVQYELRGSENSTS